jgi:hypothetical protein
MGRESQRDHGVEEDDVKARLVSNTRDVGAWRSRLEVMWMKEEESWEREEEILEEVGTAKTAREKEERRVGASFLPRSGNVAVSHLGSDSVAEGACLSGKNARQERPASISTHRLCAESV